MDDFPYLNTGARYNPSTDSWTATNTTNAPALRSSHTAVWTGSEMIVWGGFNGNSVLNTGGRYNPSDGQLDSHQPHQRARCSRPAQGSVDRQRNDHLGRSNGGPLLNTGGRYNPSTDSWTASSTNNAPAGRFNHTAVWTGSEMIVWGGQSDNGRSEYRRQIQSQHG